MKNYLFLALCAGSMLRATDNTKLIAFTTVSHEHEAGSSIIKFSTTLELPTERLNYTSRYTQAFVLNESEPVKFKDADATKPTTQAQGEVLAQLKQFNEHHTSTQIKNIENYKNKSGYYIAISACAHVNNKGLRDEISLPKELIDADEEKA